VSERDPVAIVRRAGRIDRALEIFAYVAAAVAVAGVAWAKLHGHG
jgi:hypothetical protein